MDLLVIQSSEPASKTISKPVINYSFNSLFLRLANSLSHCVRLQRRFADPRRSDQHQDPRSESFQQLPGHPQRDGPLLSQRQLANRFPARDEIRRLHVPLRT